MNDIKNSLIETAGDFEENKERIRNYLYYNNQKSNNKKQTILSAIAAVAMISILFVFSTFLVNQQNEQTAQTGLFNEEYFNYKLKMANALDFNGQVNTLQQVYTEYELELAMFTYVQSLGYEITQPNSEKVVQILQTQFGTKDYEEVYTEFLSMIGMSKEEYEQVILLSAPFIDARNKLKEHFMDLYPKIDSNIAGSLAEKHAIPYFRENYVEEIAAFKESKEIQPDFTVSGPGTKVGGRIIAIEDNSFLVVPSATIEDIKSMDVDEIVKKYNEGYWYPKDTTVELSIGDYVDVFSSLIIGNSIPNIADLWELHLIDDYVKDPSSSYQTIKLNIPTENMNKVEVFLNILNWEKVNFDMSRNADFEFEINNKTYFIWVHEDGYVLTTSTGAYRKLNKEFTQELSEYLAIK